MKSNNIIKLLKEQSNELKIMYVEDDICIRDNLTNMLKKLFHTVDIEEDG